MSYHSCKTWRPHDAKKGATYTCICGVRWQLVRGGLFKKWVEVKKNDSVRG